MIVIFQTTVSIVISCINIFIVWYKLHKKIFPRFQLVISYSLQIMVWRRQGSENGLAPKRRQVIIWTNDNPAYKHIYAPVGFLLVLLANMRRTGLCKLIVGDTNLPLPRRHNEDAGVSNHRIDCSLQRLFRRRSKILFFSNMDAKRTVWINLPWRNKKKKKKTMPHAAHIIWLISIMEAVMNLYVINVGNALH